MEQHPVPQDITSYRFRLVGDMTLKQFLELASGIGFAWIIYATPLNPLIKWPLLFFSASFGAALAFLPLEERPLDVWIANFFKAIYRPTQFLWQRVPQIPDFLKPKTKKAIPKTPPISPKDRQKLEEYLRSLPTEERVDKEEKAKLKRINQFFQEAGLLISKRKPAPPPGAPSQPTPPSFYEPKLAFEKLQEERTREEILRETGQLREPPKPPKKIPEPVVAQRSEGAAPVIEPAEPFAPPLRVKTDVIFRKPPEKVEEVPVAPSLPMPSTPTIPNVLAGMTLTPEEEILPEAIIEIQDKNSFPVRALRSNKLGQFFIATPLPRGEYQIEVEHPNYKFAIMRIKLNNKIIPPLKIKAKEKREV